MLYPKGISPDDKTNIEHIYSYPNINSGEYRLETILNKIGHNDQNLFLHVLINDYY